MKRKVYPIILACLTAGLFTAGCQHGQGVDWIGSEDQLQRIQSIAWTAAYIPAAITLRDKPDSLEKIRMVRNAVNGLLSNPQVDPAGLAGVLAAFGDEAGAPGDVAIIITGLSVMLTGQGGLIEIDNAPRAKAAALGIRDGLDAALIPYLPHL